MDARSSTSSSERSVPLGAAYLRALAFAMPLFALIWAAGLFCTLAFPDVAGLKYQAMFDPGARQANIIVGSSVAGYGIDPRYLERPGSSFFNYAYNGGGPEFINQWYKEFKAQQAPPKLVIYSIEWFSLKIGAKGTRKLRYDYKYFPAYRQIDSIYRGHSPVADAVWRMFPLLRNHERLQNWALGQASPLRIEYARYYHGFVPINSSADEMTPYLANYTRAPVDPACLAAFRDGLAEMQRDGARVVIVHPPFYAPVVGAHPTEEALIAAIAREHHVPFLDYAGTLGSSLSHDRSLFVDDRHLNEKGSQCFSRQLARDLRSRALI